MRPFLADIRFAARSLAKSPAFLASAVAMLALGVGVNTALFSMLWTLLWRPLPFSNPDRVAVATVATLDAVREWEGAPGVEAVGAVASRTWGMRRGGGPVDVVQSAMVSPGFFAALGIGVEMRPDTREVWLSHQLWRSKFGGASAAGERITLNEEPYLVAGVLPESFRFPIRGALPDLYFPLVPANGGTAFAVVRLAPGVPLATAEGALRMIGERLTPPVRTNLHSLDEELRGGRKTEIWLLTAAALLMLGIAVANVGNLLVSRAGARSRETALRLSLGATRWQLLRGRLAEGVCISVGGLVVGVLTARWCIDLAPHASELFPALRGAALLEAPHLDWRAFAFASLVATLAALGFTAMPVGVRGRGRFVLIAAQVALSFNLLFCGALLLRSLINVVSTSPGFDARGVVTAGIGLPEVRYNSEARMLGFHESAMERLRTVPGVEQVAAAIPIPMTNRMRTRWGPELRDVAASSVVSTGYFHLLRIPLLRGRDFTQHDRLGQPAVCIVSESLPGAEVGRRVKASMTNGPSYPRGTEWEIVGIVRDVRDLGLEQPPEPHIYFPLGQVVTEGLLYLMRTDATPELMAASVNTAIGSIDASLERLQPRSLDRVIESTWRDRRWVVALVGAFAVTGLLLAAAGLYGLVAHRVARRTREIGVRMALGAGDGATIRLVMADALRPVLVGLVCGGVLAVASVRLLAGQLLGVSAADPTSAGVAAAALLLASLAASAHPAWRATRIAVTEALRVE